MSAFQEWESNQPWLDIRCSLGEGPFFEEGSGTVRFLDIKQKRIHQASLKDGISSLKTIQLDVAPTVTCNIAGVKPNDRILIAVKTGIAILDWKTGQYEVIGTFPPNRRLRSNDGSADPQGRFWVATMTDFEFGECKPEGSLYYFTKGHQAVEVLKDLIIPNSVGWSPDNSIMYFTHSTAHQVLALDYDVATGQVTNQRVFYEHKGPGDPDGFRVDMEGNIWHAIYGESRVIKISPAGELIGQINLPTRNITCVQFAGTELVITTAADEDSDDETSRRFGGAVFKVDVGVRGLELFDFRLDAE
ncbi:unnamed protein product [Clonostachys rosea]|uniref:SMP-30/Gluconolactonase/LRE-like region domain-containing protein n=1 Tax=Bionectria ochroleuca TaxID=29856 RepID=A0ABY6UMN4_BIOOC|nr:unnamed protein product [Clonostachys rosea]